MATKSTSTKSTSTATSPRSAQGRLQLVIDEGQTPWRLDETTRAIGRKGVAQAREVLRSSRPPLLDEAA